MEKWEPGTVTTQTTAKPEDIEKATGAPQMGPSEEESSRSGFTEQESSMVGIKEEAAGGEWRSLIGGDTTPSDSSFTDVLYSDLSHSKTDELYSSSSAVCWNSLDASGDGSSHGVLGPDHCEERASRPGNSRIPGKDHRRYYHNHWRLEYLMDFNARCHSMICMVCGSSLATLKLSTIKRHILQKHPYSLSWTSSEKEVIIGSWDAHLSVDAQTLTSPEDSSVAVPKKRRRRLPPVTKAKWRPILSPELLQFSLPDTSHLEQYLNESFQQWFRVEFLIDYDAQGNQLHCMICATVLPSLNLTDIKYHILNTHPTSLQFTPTQKSVILDAWANRAEMAEEEMEEDVEEEEEEEEDQGIKEAQEAGEFDLSNEKESLEEPDIEKSATESEVMEVDIGDSMKEKHQLEKKKLSNVLRMEEEILKMKANKNPEDEKLKVRDIQCQIEKQVNNSDTLSLEKEAKISKETFIPREEKFKVKETPSEDSKNIDPKAALMPENQTKPNETQKTEENKTNEVQSLKEEQKKFEEHNYVEHILINEDGRHQAGNIHELEHKTTEVLDGSLLKQQTEVKKQQYTTDSQTVEEKKSFLDGKTKQTVQVQHVDLNGQAVMGIGLPVLKVDSPTPIIIARVSVIPDSSIIQPMKPCLLKSRKSTNFQPITPAPVQPVKLVQPIKSTLAQYPVPSTVQPNVPVLVQSTTPAPVKPTANASVQHTVPAVVQPSLSAPVQPTVNALVKPKEPVLVQPTIAQAMVSTQVQSTLPAVVQPTVTPPVQQTVPAPVQLIKLTPVQSLSPSPSLPLKPSLFASTTPTEPTKSWRAIAPKAAAKVSSVDSSIPKPPSADGARWPLGVVPMLWEVCLWRESKEHGHLSAYQLRWRSDYLMDYNGLRGSVVCMYCCSSLSVLKESSIKRHIIQKHPHTGNFTADERTTVINEWETRLVEVKKMVEDTKKSETTCDSDTTQKNHIVGNCDTVEEADGEKNPLISGQPVESKGASWEFAFGRVQGKAKDPRRYQHDQWKLEYLMDYTPNKDGLICMVCGVTLINPKISTVKMHIQQKHPDTTYLSDQEKAVVMEEWEQKMVSGHNETAQQDGEDEICIEINEESATSATNGSNVGNCSPQSKHTVPTSSKTSSSVPTLPPPCNSAKRNYQVSWRTEFMMDYDCRRQGLICMVCGGTLATLKVSTIKRHIVQVHPYSVDFTAEERQRILEAYSEMALHYIHSEECFKQQPQEEVKKNKRKTPADSK